MSALASWASSANIITVNAGDLRDRISRTTWRTEEGAVVGSDVISNGNFASDTVWIKPAGGTISGNVGTWNGNGNFRQNVTLAAGYWEIRWTLSSYTSGAFRVQGWTETAPLRYNDGSFRDILNLPSGSSAIFISGSDTASASVSLISVKPITNVVVDWNPRLVAFTGDSIATNACLNYPDIFPGDTAYAHSLALAGISLTNLAVGDQTFSFVRNSGIPACIASGARTIIIHCGVNDVDDARTWNDVLSDLNNIRSQVTNQDLFIDEILPWTAGSDAQAVTIRTWNTNFSVWCSTNNAHLISSHDRMGQIRAGTGQLDDLKSTYNADGVHPNTGGYNVLWSVWLSALESFYGVPVR